MTRPPGCYWVRQHPKSPAEIGEWRDGEWNLCGCEVTYSEVALVISGRIKEPGTELTHDEVSHSCDLTARTSGFAIRLALTPHPNGKHG